MTTLTAPTQAKSTESANGQKPSVIVSTSPATGRYLGEVPITPLESVPTVMAKARAAQSGWFRAGLRHRIDVLRRIKNALHLNMDLIISTQIAEQGKPPMDALQEFWAAIETFAFYIRRSQETLAPRRVMATLLPHRIYWIERRPYGVVLTITPWNYPLLLSTAPIAAALAAGNTVIWKPSEYATQIAALFTKIMRDAGVPEDVFQTVYGAGDLGAALIKAKPNKISFTGSVPTGRKIAAAAGELLIPCQLELGAKDAAIVLDDADLDRSARGIVWGGLQNAGQACLSIEQVYVARSVMEPFIKIMTEVIEREIKVGPGEAPGVTMGAISTQLQMDVIEGQLADAVAKGAQVIAGGKRLEGGNGRLFPPTLLTKVNPDMKIMRDETFGPILVIIPFDRDDEAVSMSNASPYGLTASVWTRNRARGLAMIDQLEVGHAAVNDHIMSASIPYLPWGGTKDSGYGASRGKEGLIEMTRAQSFSIERFAPLHTEVLWYPYTPQKYNLLRRALRALYAPTIAEKIRLLIGR
ncbi:MAG: aldehyde dehydrogenase family protein [Anaerolinea sp.]|nr:aldehyde dehydrogenase family protein [Anaerolinea sp.]MCC6973110.1 aldehyde dehydrogenase family protein [Anaerolineae bacterium]CAG1012110.1 succinate-semialdehyde dehydrogenase / glutarate-semialdehyde dehydrogenase [Anaerolineales bacterium]